MVPGNGRAIGEGLESARAIRPGRTSWPTSLSAYHHGERQPVACDGDGPECQCIRLTLVATAVAIGGRTGRSAGVAVRRLASIGLLAITPREPHVVTHAGLRVWPQENATCRLEPQICAGGLISQLTDVAHRHGFVSMSSFRVESMAFPGAGHMTSG